MKNYLDENLLLEGKDKKTFYKELKALEEATIYFEKKDTSGIEVISYLSEDKTNVKGERYSFDKKEYVVFNKDYFDDLESEKELDNFRRNKTILIVDDALLLTSDRFVETWSDRVGVKSSSNKKMPVPRNTYFSAIMFEKNEKMKFVLRKVKKGGKNKNKIFALMSNKWYRYPLTSIFDFLKYFEERYGKSKVFKYSITQLISYGMFEFKNIRQDSNLIPGIIIQMSDTANSSVIIIPYYRIEDTDVVLLKEELVHLKCVKEYKDILEEVMESSEKSIFDDYDNVSEKLSKSHRRFKEVLFNFEKEVFKRDTINKKKYKTEVENLFKRNKMSVNLRYETSCKLINEIIKSKTLSLNINRERYMQKAMFISLMNE